MTSYMNFQNRVQAGTEIWSQGLGLACNQGTNQCKGFDVNGQPQQGGGNLRHYQQGDQCYEFCATTSDLYAPHFQGTVAAKKHGQGQSVWNDDPGISWPAALGDHGDFAKNAESKFATGPCGRGSGDVNYHPAWQDYTTQWWASRPGSCPDDTIRGVTVMANMRIPQTGGFIPPIDNCDATPADICTWNPVNPVDQKCPAPSCVQWDPVMWSPVSEAVVQPYTCFNESAMAKNMFTRGSDGQCVNSGGACEGQDPTVMTDRCVQPVCNNGKLECGQCAEGFSINKSRQGTSGVCQWTTDKNYWTRQLGGSCNDGLSQCQNGASVECQVVNNVTTPAHWLINPEFINSAVDALNKEEEERMTFDKFNIAAGGEDGVNWLQNAGIITSYGGASHRRYGFERCHTNTVNIPIAYSREGLHEVEVSGWGAIANKTDNQLGGGAVLRTVSAVPDSATKDKLGQICQLGVTGWSNQTSMWDISKCDPDQIKGTGNRCIVDGLYQPRFGDYGQVIEGHCPVGLSPWEDEKKSQVTQGACVQGQTAMNVFGKDGLDHELISAKPCTTWGPAFDYAPSEQQFGINFLNA